MKATSPELIGNEFVPRHDVLGPLAKYWSPPAPPHATCPPSSGRVETTYDPWRYVAVLVRKPGALRNGAPFKDLVLPAAMERVRRKLADPDDCNRQMVDSLNAVQTERLPAVEATCAEALGHGVHSADVVLNILAQDDSEAEQRIGAAIIPRPANGRTSLP